MTETHFKFVILGGGNSAGYCADQLIKLGLQKGDLAIISNEPVPPYERPALSKAYIHPPQAKVRARLPGFYTCVGAGGERHDEKWYQEKGIQLLLNAECENVNVRTKSLTVVFKDNQRTQLVTYDKMVVATGARAITPVEAGLPGGQLKQIFTIRTEADAAKIVKAMENLTTQKEAAAKQAEEARETGVRRALSHNSSSQVFAKARRNSDTPSFQIQNLQVNNDGNRFGHQQSSKLRDKMKEQLNVKAAVRNAIYTKLHEFYKKHDQKKLEDYETMSGLITFIETFGYEDLNQTLIQKYGEGMDKPQPSVAKYLVVTDGMASRNEIYAKLFLFYSKHDSSRIPELEVAVEVIINVGIEEFNRRCQEKYGENLESQLIENIQHLQEEPTQKAPPMPRKQAYGRAETETKTEEGGSSKLVSLDDEMEQVLIKLVCFYALHDGTTAEEIHKIVTFIIDNGISMFDVLAQEKYKASLTDFLDEVYKDDLSKYEELSTPDKKTELYKALVRFYMYKEQSKLGKLLDIVSYIMYRGMEDFNQKLLEKYGETIKEEPGDLIKEKNYIFNKLTRFYQRNDQTKLNDLENIVTYIMLNGVEEFNDLLIERYGSGLEEIQGVQDVERIMISNCLTDYYAKKDPDKLRNIENLVSYALTHGIETLDKQVMEKYGESLGYERYRNHEVNQMTTHITAGHNLTPFDHGMLKNPHVVIIGGGYIGIETASAFSGWGFDVTLVIAHKLAMSKLFTVKMAAWFERYFEENCSINIVKQTRVVEFKGTDQVKQVVLSNGEVLDCDVVICGIGGKPNIELFEGQLEILNIDMSKKGTQDLGGIIVDEYLKSSDPDVYVMGDVAAFPHGKYLSRLEHVDNCRKSAIAVAHNLVASDNDYAPDAEPPRKYVYFPYFYSRMFEYTDTPVIFRFYGEKGSPGETSVVQFGDFNSSRTSMFGAFWIRRDNSAVIGGLLCNASKEFYDKLYDIILSSPKLVPQTQERALSLFNEEMIVDLI